MFKYSADLGGKLTLAMTTAPQAFTDALCRVRRYIGQPVHCAEMGARLAVRPDSAFEVQRHLGLVVKLGAGKCRHRKSYHFSVVSPSLTVFAR